MSFLIIDTAFENCQIGLYRNGELTAQANDFAHGGQHDRILATMVEKLFSDTKTTINDIEKIIVTVGPGRFTGLRVGIAFARGLALVNKTPITAVMTNDAIAYDLNKKYPDEKNKAVLVCVKRGESFVQFFSPEASDLISIADDDLEKAILEQGSPLIAGVLSPAAKAMGLKNLSDITQPSLKAIAALGIQAPISPVVRPYYAGSTGS